MNFSSILTDFHSGEILFYDTVSNLLKIFLHFDCVLFISYVKKSLNLKHLTTSFCIQGFPDSSVGKESACNAGDSSLIPGMGRSSGEGIGYPLQYAWASLVAQVVKNLPAMWETWVRSLGWEDSLEKGKATHSSILAWRIPWTV